MQNSIFNQYLSTINRFANTKIKINFLTYLILKSTSIKRKSYLKFFLNQQWHQTQFILNITFCITFFFFTSLYRDRTHTELSLLDYVNHQHYTSPSSKYRYQKGKRGWRKGGGGQAQRAGLCYWSKPSFLNQIVPSTKMAKPI